MLWTWALSGYRRLSREDRSTAGLAIVLLVATRVGLRLVGTDTWRSCVTRVAKRARMTAAPDAERRQTAARTAHLVVGAARRIRPNPSCLHRSLVLHSLLRARGLDAEIRFGVRRRADQFEAHAWVEYDGEPLTDPDDVHGGYASMHGPRLTSQLRDGGAD